MADGRGSLFLLALLTACVAKSADDTDEDAGASTTLGAAAQCVWNEPADECRAKPDVCEFREAVERGWVGGECTVVEGEAGWCETLDNEGGSDARSAWYEVATGRVFSLSQIPFSPPEGWELCTCGPPSPEACACDPNCEPVDDTADSSRD